MAIIKKTQKLSKSLKIQHPLKTQKCAMKLSEMASSSNSRWQNRKEHSNRSTNNGNMAVTSM